MSQKYVGVDLGTHRVKVAVISLGLRGAQVLELFDSRVGASTPAEALPMALERAATILRERDLLAHPVGVALPEEFASYRLLRFPFSDVRRIDQAVGFEAEGQFPTPLEDLELDHVATPGPDGGGQALLTAARKDRIELATETLRALGLDVRLVTVAPMAVAQVLDVPAEASMSSAKATDDGETPQPAVTLVLDVGHRTTTFLALTSKGPVAARTLRRGGRQVTQAVEKAYALDSAAAEKAKHDDAFLPHRALAAMSDAQMEAGRVVAGAVEDIVRELERTRMWLSSTHGYDVSRLVLLGGGGRLEGLSEYLAEQTDLPVFEPELKRQIRGPADYDYGSSYAALGAALGVARRPLVQLFSATDEDTDGGWLQERMGTLSAIGFALVMFGSLDTLAQEKTLEEERAAYAAELATVTQRAFGESLTKVSEIEKKLDDVEGEDLTSMVPRRGALEVLDLISQAAKPVDTGSDKPGDPAAEAGGGEAAAGGSPDEPPGAEGDAEEDKTLAPVAATGIVADDELIVSVVEIRERKVELRVLANRSSAGERLALKLQETGCLLNVQKGKVRDQNDKKRFDMTMDNTCFTSDLTEEEEG